jgi:hypothetical protein
MAARDPRPLAVADLDDGRIVIDVKRLPSEPPAELPQLPQEEEKDRDEPD